MWRVSDAEARRREAMADYSLESRRRSAEAASCTCQITSSNARRQLSQRINCRLIPGRLRH
jgi:hypothetical protein